MNAAALFPIHYEHKKNALALVSSIVCSAVILDCICQCLKELGESVDEVLQIQGGYGWTIEPSKIEGARFLQ